MNSSSDSSDPDFPTDTDEQPFILPDAVKLAALAEFAAGAGHEINNPLATIIGRAQLLLKDESDPQRRQMLMSIGAQAYRIRDMIGDTMLFGRPPLPDLKQINLAELIKSVVNKQSADLVIDRCRVHLGDIEVIRLQADPAQFAVVIDELLRNSRQALQPQGGFIEISATKKSGRAVIEIIDDGKGFSDLERQHAFDPFFSGRQAGRGLGFGLPKCWRIVQQHGGTIGIQSIQGGRTMVRVIWPTVDVKIEETRRSDE